MGALLVNRRLDEADVTITAEQAAAATRVIRDRCPTTRTSSSTSSDW